MMQPVTKDETFMTEFEKLEKLTAPPFRKQGKKLNFRPTQTPSMNFQEAVNIQDGGLDSKHQNLSTNQLDIEDKENRSEDSNINSRFQSRNMEVNNSRGGLLNKTRKFGPRSPLVDTLASTKNQNNIAVNTLNTLESNQALPMYQGGTFNEGSLVHNMQSQKSRKQLISNNILTSSINNMSREGYY
jgi:hypothetical protein